MKPIYPRSTVYYIEDAIYDQFEALPAYINRSEFLRHLLNEDRRIRLRPRRSRGYHENTRAIEVQEILRKKLPLLLKRYREIGRLITPAKRRKRK